MRLIEIDAAEMPAICGQSFRAQYQKITRCHTAVRRQSAPSSTARRIPRETFALSDAVAASHVIQRWSTTRDFDMAYRRHEGTHNLPSVWKG
jgi:hypothetical protein